MEEELSETKQTDNKEPTRKDNPFMPDSKPLTKEEYDKLPRTATLGFRFTTNEQSWTAQLKICGEKAQIAVESDSTVLQPNDNSTSLFIVEQDGKRLVYPPMGLSEETKEAAATESGSDGYYIDGLKPKVVEVDKSEIEQLEVNSLADLISKTSGKSLVFYTGAGISMGGERPVWGMTQLSQNLGLDNDAKGFTQHFKNPNEYHPEELLKKVHEFRQQLFNDVSTPAHSAISEIVQIKEGAIVFTENIDLKHEAKGSRLAAVHMDSDENSFNKVKLRAPDATVLVTIGLSKDDRAAIQYLKKVNPKLKIVAFTLSEETIPDYLDKDDAVVLGDVQEILPKVAQRISGNN